MIIKKPEVLVPVNQLDTQILTKLERYARVCYKSESNIKGNDASFLKNIINNGHESVIEHEKATVLFIVDRGISHELVRHRIASYSQESTRYCNYSKEQFGSELSVIEPFFLIDSNAYEYWKEACLNIEKCYMLMLKSNCSPQEARAVLPNCLKTEIVVTFNFREWRHFFRLRCSIKAHPQMKQVTIPLLLYFKRKLPVLFEDIPYDKKFPVEHYANIIETDDLLNTI